MTGRLSNADLDTIDRDRVVYGPGWFPQWYYARPSYDPRFISSDNDDGRRNRLEFPIERLPWLDEPVLVPIPELEKWGERVYSIFPRSETTLQDAPGWKSPYSGLVAGTHLYHSYTGRI
mgnify:CR=1 FL=1